MTKTCRHEIQQGLRAEKHHKAMARCLEGVGGQMWGDGGCRRACKSREEQEYQTGCSRLSDSVPCHPIRRTWRTRASNGIVESLSDPDLFVTGRDSRRFGSVEVTARAVDDPRTPQRVQRGDGQSRPNPKGHRQSAPAESCKTKIGVSQGIVIACARCPPMMLWLNRCQQARRLAYPSSAVDVRKHINWRATGMEGRQVWLRHRKPDSSFVR